MSNNYNNSDGIPFKKDKMESIKITVGSTTPNNIFCKINTEINYDWDLKEDLSKCDEPIAPTPKAFNNNSVQAIQMIDEMIENLNVTINQIIPSINEFTFNKIELVNNYNDFYNNASNYFLSNGMDLDVFNNAKVNAFSYGIFIQNGANNLPDNIKSFILMISFIERLEKQYPNLYKKMLSSLTINFEEELISDMLNNNSLLKVYNKKYKNLNNSWILIPVLVNILNNLDINNFQYIKDKFKSNQFEDNIFNMGIKHYCKRIYNIKVNTNNNYFNSLYNNKINYLKQYDNENFTYSDFDRIMC